MSVSCHTPVFLLDTVNSLTRSNAKKASSIAVAKQCSCVKKNEQTEGNAVTSWLNKGKVIVALMSGGI